MKLTFNAVFNLMKLFTEEDWGILFSENFSPIVSLNLAIENKKIKQQKNKKKHLAILNFCFQNRSAFKNENFNDEKFTIEITKTVYSLKNFDITIHEKELKNIKTRLSEVRKLYIYPFFGLKELISSAEEFDLAINTLIYFDKNQQEKEFLITADDLLKNLINNTYQNRKSSEQFYKYYDNQARHFSINNNIDINLSLKNSLKYFELFSLFEKLEKNIGLLNIALGKNKTTEKLNFAIKKPTKEQLAENLLLKIDFKLYQLLHNDYINKYQNVEKKITEILTLIKLVDTKMLYDKLPYKTQLNTLRVYCLRKGVENNKTNLKITIETIDLLRKNNLILQRGKINHVSFKNIIVLFLKANENDKAKSFFDEYESYIKPDKNDLTDAIKNYSLGLIYLDKKNYKTAGILFSSTQSINHPILNLYYRQAQLILAIQEAFSQKNSEFRKNNQFLKSNIKTNETFLKKLKQKPPETKNLENLIKFAKTCFKTKNFNINEKPLTFLQNKWLNEVFS